MSTSENVERLRELVLGTKALMNVMGKLSQTAQAELAGELANEFYALHRKLRSAKGHSWPYSLLAGIQKRRLARRCT